MEQWRSLAIFGCCPCLRRGRLRVWRDVRRPAEVRWVREVETRVAMFSLFVVLVPVRGVDGVDQ
eukprot:4955167-Pleurochrysis_carterae.AAC.1